jgi:hypothetical protein
MAIGHNKSGVGNFRPKDCGVQHHGLRNAHCSLYSTLGICVVMVSASTGESHDLSELTKLACGTG